MDESVSIVHLNWIVVNCNDAIHSLADEDITLSSAADDNDKFDSILCAWAQFVIDCNWILDKS